MIPVMASTSPRPAHRPSRRADVVEACLLLAANRPLDEVTVADIAAAADMTSAAIYYHFVSKEDILREGLEQFTEALVTQTTQTLDAAPTEGKQVGDVLAGLVSWLDTERASATVYFSTSSGQSLAVEVIRRRTRGALVELFREYLSVARRDLSRAEAAVASVGLLALLETSSTAWLRQDADWLALGPRRFLETVAQLAESLVGPPVRKPARTAK
jgi:AcrR family transcriptional regulator